MDLSARHLPRGIQPENLPPIRRGGSNIEKSSGNWFETGIQISVSKFRYSLMAV